MEGALWALPRKGSPRRREGVGDDFLLRGLPRGGGARGREGVCATPTKKKTTPSELTMRSESTIAL